MKDKINDDIDDPLGNASDKEEYPQENADLQDVHDEDQVGTDMEPESEEGKETADTSLQQALTEAHDKYLRLYAEFENYKKFAAKQREELLQYAHEHIMSDLLTAIDHLELALHHASEDSERSSLVEGVEMTLKELLSILGKHGLSSIKSSGKPFDPHVHQAMSQMETDDIDENMVVKEFRKGYMYKDRVLRASLVEVSKKPSQSQDDESRELEEED